VLTGSAFRCDSTQFDAHRVLTLRKVSERMAVPAYAAVELSPAAERTTGEAEPQVLLEIAFRTMCRTCVPSNLVRLIAGESRWRTVRRNVARGELGERERVLTG
jgi:hypothetical protein